MSHKMINGVIVPTVHLNGTSRRDLEENIAKAQAALTQARDMLALTYPNGRDYYPQGPSAIGVAMEQHDSRMKRIQDVHDELMEIYEGMQA